MAVVIIVQKTCTHFGVIRSLEQTFPKAIVVNLASITIQDLESDIDLDSDSVYIVQDFDCAPRILREKLTKMISSLKESVR